MSVQAITEVWKLAIPATPKLVLLSLADQANDSGICWPSQPQIAARCSLTDRAVRDQLAWLESVNVIRREVRVGRGTVFHLTISECTQPRNEVPPRNSVPVTPEQSSGHPGTTFRQTVSKRKEPSGEPVADRKNSLHCPVEKIVASYHDAMPANPRVKVLSDQRRKAITARWREASTLTCKPFGYSNVDDGIAAWREFFATCSESKFLTGRTVPQPGRAPFLADLDFLTSPIKFAKVLENFYHREAE